MSRECSFFNFKNYFRNCAFGVMPVVHNFGNSFAKQTNKENKTTNKLTKKAFVRVCVRYFFRDLKIFFLLIARIFYKVVRHLADRQLTETGSWPTIVRERKREKKREREKERER